MNKCKLVPYISAICPSIHKLQLNILEKLHFLTKMNKGWKVLGCRTENNKEKLKNYQNED